VTDLIDHWRAQHAADRQRADDLARERRALAAATTAQERSRAADDGGLVAYAEALARRRYPAKAASMQHLAPLAEKCESAERAMRGEQPPVYAVMHAAVQHGKTSLLQAFVLRTLRRNPRAVIGYVAFNADRATGKMWECRELAEDAGVRLHPTFNTKSEWRTVEGGIVKPGGILDGSWTGGGFDLLICDDLYSGPEEAESRAHRLKVEHAFDTVLETRGQGRTSILVNMARWNPYDISGVLIKRGWPYVRLPAINHRGEALWPDVVPLAYLIGKRDGRPATEGQPAIAPIPRRVWAAMYQGEPIGEGSNVFLPSMLRWYGGPHHEALPTGPYREAMGIDVCYGAKTRNDRSAAVTLRSYMHRPRDLFMVGAWIGHEPIEVFAPTVAKLQTRDGRRILTLWYASGTEKGGEGVLRNGGARVEVVNAGIDKLARARGGYVDPEIGGFTSAWNDGRVYWPAVENEHARTIRGQHEDFTGAPTDEDDGVDAAVAAHDALQAQELAALMKAAQERARGHAPRRVALAPDGAPARPMRLGW
jgi:hypothetical protein